MTERKAKIAASLEEKERNGFGNKSKSKTSKVTNHNQIVMKNSRSEEFKMNKDSRVPVPEKSKPEPVNIDKENNKYGHTNGAPVEIRVENMDTNALWTPDEKSHRRHRRVSDVIDSIGLENIGSRRRSTSLSDSPYTPPLSPAKTGSRRGSIGISRTPTPPSTPASDTGYNSYGYSTPHSPSAISPDVPTRPLPPRRVADAVDAAAMSQPIQQEPDEPMSLAVAEAFMPVEKDADEYNMNHPRRGHAVIFNHEKFNNQPDRDGSEVDVDNLCKLYTQLGFQVTTHHNKEYQEIMDIIRNLAREDHSDEDCLMVTVLTHGMTTGYIFSSDMPYSVDHLWLPFTADKCLTLAGKPKIFIIQACRGEQLDPGVNLIRKRSRTETDSSGGSYKIPTHADFLIAYSSVEGFFSWRNPESGTWFIQCLCQELLANGGNLDFLKILTRTARRVALDHESYNEVNPWQHQQKQVPAINSMLIRDIYFRPK